MNLSEMFDYKNQLMKDILTDPEITNLIDDKCVDTKELAYTRVFPFQFVPDTVEEGTVFVCMDVDIEKIYDNLTLIPAITIWVFAHKSMLHMEGIGVRTDILCSKICERINGSLYYGLGGLELKSVRRYAPMTDYQGKIMTFRTKEFNRVHNPNRVVPANRKCNKQ